LHYFIYSLSIKHGEDKTTASTCLYQTYKLTLCLFENTAYIIHKPATQTKQIQFAEECNTCLRRFSFRKRVFIATRLCPCTYMHDKSL